jgi:hypothetical protein
MKKYRRQRIWHADVQRRTKITLCVFRDLEAGLATAEEFNPSSHSAAAAACVRDKTESRESYDLWYCVFGILRLSRECSARWNLEFRVGRTVRAFVPI